MRVLYVLATGRRRGAETFAAGLLRALKDGSIHQSVAILHGPDEIGFSAPVVELGTGWRGARSLYRVIRSLRVQIVLAYGGEALKHCIPAMQGTSAKLVYRRIGSAHERLSTGIRRAGYGALMRRADLVVSNSELLRQETVALFRVPRERCRTIPNGRDVDSLLPTRGRTATRRELGIPAHVPVVLSIGAVSWEKDPVAQLEVFRLVLAETPEARLLMAGDGPLFSRVGREVQRLKLGGSVVLLGTRSDVPELLAAADAVILASRTEGMPGVLIEAGMAGLPVASYDIGGVPEVVEDGLTGFVAPSGRMDILSRGLIKLLGDEDLRRLMGEAARVRCVERFDITVIAPQYRQLFRELIAS